MQFKTPDRYYNLPAWLAWCLSLVGAILAGGLMTTFFDATESRTWLWFFFPFLLPPIVLLTTPLMRVAGIYKYYSPLFLTFGETPKRYEIHSGPSIDYLLSLRGIRPGGDLRRTVLAFYLQGILEIAEKVAAADAGATEGIKAEDVTIIGTSYFFSDRSVERMGFTVGPGGWFHRINLLLNLPELFLLNSLSAGKPAFPNVFVVKAAQMSGATLLEHRDYIQRLYARMATDRNREYIVDNAETQGLG